MFDSYRLRALQRFALTCGEGAGLTGAEQERLYDLLDIWDGTKPGMPVDAGHNLNLRDVFKSPNAFKNALRDDVDAALLAAGWRKVTLEQNGDTFHAFFRSVLDVIMALIRDSGDVQYWSGAFKLYPLRVRVVNVITDEVRFVTVAYIPVVRKRTEAGAEEKARRRRSAVLQRVLYLAFRTAIGASHSGKEVLVGDRVLLAFPRILLYLADLPEEKAVLCINSGE
eukprot:contig_8529_g2004